jgi:17beta-estradiol 17-dehydrogenase / very-long-chain 3-oxoacyl-CoA reductase
MPSPFILVAVAFLVIELVILIWRTAQFAWKYFLCREKDLVQRYGSGSYAVVTGASSGQGRIFATELARRGFNLVLIGSSRCAGTRDEIKSLYPAQDVIVIVKDFGRAAEADFFDDINRTLDNLDVSILVNNVAHRTAWIPYHEMPVNMINATIAVGTYVQARLIHAVVGRMSRRYARSAIVNITAQCQHTTWGLGHLGDTAISVPFLSVYEAANAFGYYHAMSIMKEYSGESIDILNITPGAVLTENTGCLAGTPFAVSAERFVANVLRLMGNWQGTTCAYWGHELSGFLINLAPWIKTSMLEDVGRKIATTVMMGPRKKY